MIRNTIALVVFSSFAVAPCFAQAQINSGAVTGDTFGHSTSKTNQGQEGMGVNDSASTNKENTNRQGLTNARQFSLKPAGFGPCAKVFGGGSGLPPTELTSIVKESGKSEEIYGDEGTTSYPPLFSFQKQNRIESGFF